MKTIALTSDEGKVTDTARPVPLGVKLLYGVGDIANSVKTILFALFTLYFYTSVMGLPGTLVGIATAIGLVLDAVLDPYIGHLSDQAMRRFNSRHTLMLAGAATMGLSLWAFFSPPRNLGTGGLFVWLLVTGTLVRLTTSLYGIPYFAVGADLSQDYHERTSITAIRGGLALVGTLMAAGLSFILFFPDSAAGMDPKLRYEGYPLMGVAFGALMTGVALTALVATLLWRSRSTPAPNAARTTIGRFLAGFGDSMRNRSFRAILLSMGLFFFGVAINNVFAIYYFTYYARVGQSTALSAFQLAFYVGGVVGVGCWLGLIRRLHLSKHRAYQLSTLVLGVIVLAAYYLVGQGRPLGTGNVSALLIGHALGGFLGSVIWFMPASMIADVADEDELLVGHRRQGLFFGIFFFGQKVAVGFAALAGGILVDWFAGLVPGHAAQSAATIQRIGIIYSLLPACVLFVAVGLMQHYSLDQSRVAQIRVQLDRLGRAGQYTEQEVSQ
jgi:GPH family glycoside/pentoside/hexuronide:cation symporter